MFFKKDPDWPWSILIDPTPLESNAMASNLKCFISNWKKEKKKKGETFDLVGENEDCRSWWDPCQSVRNKDFFCLERPIELIQEMIDADPSTDLLTQLHLINSINTAIATST